VRFATKSALRGRRCCREEEAYFGRTYRGDLEGGSPGGSDLGALSAARDFGAKLLPVEEAVREHGAVRS
jgi:hypothetical protein